MELKNDTDALMDRVELYGFDVIDIANFDELQEKGIITVKEGAKHYLYCGDRRYTSIVISNCPVLNEFTYGVSKDGHPYGYMDVSVPYDDYHNLNCLSPERYIVWIRTICRYLWDSYGLRIGAECIKYKKMEINKTIIINDAYSEYQRVLTLLMQILPGTLRLNTAAEIRGRDEHPEKVTDYRIKKETYQKTSGEKGITIKIYDKTKNLIEKYRIEITHNYLRYEITLNSATKIRNTLGQNEICKISQETVNRYFSGFIRENVENAYKKYKEKSDAAVLKILKKNYVPANRTWIRDTVIEIMDIELKNGGVPLILDIHDLLMQLNHIKFSSRAQKSHAKKAFAEIAEKKATALSNRDDQKCMELIAKLKG